MWKGRLIFLCALAYAGGCLIGGAADVPPAAIILALSALCAACGIRFARDIDLKDKGGGILLAGILALFLVSGQANATLSARSGVLPLFDGEKVAVCGIVNADGRSRKGSRRVELTAGKEKMYLYLGEAAGNSAVITQTPFLPGDTLLFTAKIEKVENFTDDFDYVGFLARKGIFSTAYCRPEEVTLHARPSGRVRTFFLKLKTHDLLDETVLKGLPPEEAAVLKSLMVGDRGDVPEEVQENYRQSGAMHLMAVSGLHVGIVYMMVCALLSLLPGGRRLRRPKRIAALAVLFLYGWMCGMGPSVSRAVLTVTIYEAASILECRKCPLGAISASAIIICAFDPAAPRNVSFQLSYCAVLGITFLYPLLNGLLRTRSRLLRYVWQIASISIACQAGTFGVTLYHFHTFPRYFLITNLVAIPLVNCIMYSALPLYAISKIPFAAGAASSATAFFIKYLNYFIKIIAEL